MNNEDIIKRHVPDWGRWHEACRKQVIAAMNEAMNTHRWQGYRRAFGVPRPLFRNVAKNQFDEIDWNDGFTYDDYDKN